MKIIVPLSAMMLLLASCQKEVTQKQISSTITADNNEVSQDDIITFLDYEQLIGISDYGLGKTTCFSRAFTVTSDIDTLYPKRFTVRLIKDATVKVKSITIYINGRGLDTRYNATAPIGDTVMFNVVSPEHKGIPVKAPDLYNRHWLNIRLRGEDGNTGSYELDLLDATFLNKNDQPQTIFQVHTLPVLGDVAVYRN